MSRSLSWAKWRSVSSLGSRVHIAQPPRRTARTAMRFHPLIPSLPLIGLGSAGNTAGNDVMAGAVDAALRGGIRLIDTAQNYGSEIAIGDGLRRAGPEHSDGLFLSTKVDLCSLAREDPSARVKRQVSSSLERLGVERLGSVIIHWPICLDAPVSAEEEARVRREAWRALEELVRAGTVQHIGVSNWTEELIDDLLSYAQIRPSINQIEISPSCCQLELLQKCAAERIAVIAYSGFGICWLAQYFPAFVPWSADGPLHLTTNPAVQKLATEVGCTPAQLLVRWAVDKGVVAIPKSTNPKRIAESARSLDAAPELGASVVEALDALRDGRRGTAASIEAHRRIIASADYEWPPT